MTKSYTPHIAGYEIAAGLLELRLSVSELYSPRPAENMFLVLTKEEAATLYRILQEYKRISPF